jgi:hypothetical protein
MNICMYTYVAMCVCVSVCVCKRARARALAIEAEWRWLIYDVRTRLLPPHMLYSAIEADVC